MMKQASPFGIRCPRCNSLRVAVVPAWQDPDTRQVVDTGERNLYRAVALLAAVSLLALPALCLAVCLAAALVASINLVRGLSPAGQLDLLGYVTRLDLLGYAAGAAKLLVALAGLLLLLPVALLVLRACTFRLRTIRRWPQVSACTCQTCGYEFTKTPDRFSKIA